MGQSEKYGKLWERYNALHARSAEGDRAAKEEKAKVRQEMRAMEREGAREGNVLNATLDKAGKASVSVQEADSKRDLQRNYVREFEKKHGKGDEAMRVTIKDAAHPQGYETTLAEHHRKRLLGK